jgi:nickel-type superoxide dismutase maturation protease
VAPRRTSWWPPRRLAASVACAYALVLAVNRSLVTVRGPSMEPALWPGDRLLTVPAFTWLLRPGQVVVVQDPGDPQHRVVKRLVGIGEGGADVRGDAPDRSTDSRTWGPVPVSSVLRIAMARWPDLRTPLRRRGHPARRATTSNSGSSSATSPSPRRP